MSKTYLEILNSLQQRLRSNITGSVSSTPNAQLLGNIINDSKREVEDMWNWTSLRTVINITTTPGTYQYSLSGFGKRGRILPESDGGYAVYNDSDDYPLIKAPSTYINRQRILSTGSNSPPTYWSLEGQDSNDDPYIIFYQTPDQTQTIKVFCCVPQDDLSDGSDTLTIPYWPVEHLAWAYAVEERGEDRGVSRAEIFDRAYKSIADAISLDVHNVPEEVDFHVV